MHHMAIQLILIILFESEMIVLKTLKDTWKTIRKCISTKILSFLTIILTLKNLFLSI